MVWILEPPQETAALLVNAIYFKGSWANPFKREFTQTRRFDIDLNNSYVETEFMFRQGKVLLGKQNYSDFCSICFF